MVEHQLELRQTAEPAPDTVCRHARIHSLIADGLGKDDRRFPEPDRDGTVDGSALLNGRDPGDPKSGGEHIFQSEDPAVGDARAVRFERFLKAAVTR